MVWEMWDQNLKATHRNWSDCMQEVASFDNLASFWQVWLNLPHATPTNLFSVSKHTTTYVMDPIKGELAIEGICVFQQSVKPAWEDPVNAAGSDVSLKFVMGHTELKEGWDRLVMSMIGETIPQRRLSVVGCRVVDKKTYYKFEIWLNADLETAEYADAAREMREWLCTIFPRSNSHHLTNIFSTLFFRR